ncbi:MAG TPA: VWA domain-containing protein [Verrucomicrobiae bacterium]|jgi:Ca-activated chloride channel family protein|nr:VWA domain-containing protein [Verrucomicrobiae bacterium]
MHLRNRSFFLAIAFILLLGTWLIAQDSTAPAQQSGAQPQAGAPPTVQNSQPAQTPQPQNGQPPQEETPPPPNAPNQPGDTVQVPSHQGQEPSAEQNDVYIFKKEVDEVTLHATVVDDHFRPITTLTKSDFNVFEDGKPQKITSFRNEDIPVALGIVIDNSGSMRDKRPQVNAAAVNLVRSSNPQDQVFVVNFNEEYFLDQDYTGSVPKLKDALERIESRGGTALYDAVVASSDHLKKSGALEKKVLLVVTDGEDNASRESLEQALRRLEEKNGPTVYTIGLLGEEHEKRARRALREMAEDTGGVAFFPKNLDEVEAITQQIAHDIRNQYTIQYKPTTPQSAGGYRTVKVEAQAKGYKKLQVRTRSGYYAGQQRASASEPSGNP